MTREHERTITDPRVLRAVAHPVRNRILAELQATGPLRAADVTERLGVPANQASFHLRQLAKYGLVVEAPEAARDGRDRVWKVADEHGFTVSIRELDKTPGGRAAGTVLLRELNQRAHAAVDSAISRERERGDDEHVATSDASLTLSKSEAEALARDLSAVIDAWRDRTQQGAEPEDGPRRTYSVLQILQPYPEAESRS